LNNILSLSLISHQSRDEAHQLTLILGNQQLERFLISALDALNKQLIYFAFRRQIKFPCFLSCL